MTRLRAQFDGKVLIPLEPVDLPTGRVLDVEVVDAELPPGSPVLVLQAARAAPHMSSGDVDELEQAVAQGRRSVRPEGPFDRE